MILAESACEPAPLIAERAAAARALRDSPQGCLAQAIFAVPHVTTDFEVLGRRSAQQLAAQLLLCSPTSLIEAVLALRQDVTRARASSAGGLPQELVLERIRTLVRMHGVTCLRHTDWKRGSGNSPHVGLIYAILLTMSAADVHRECVRVLIKGEAVSQMFHEQLGDGYKIMLSQVRLSVSMPVANEFCPRHFAYDTSCVNVQVFDLATRLVAEGRGSVLLTAIYVGQELRGVQSNARFLRVFEHGTLAGSDVIVELVYLTSRKETGVVCTPVGDVILERRLLAIVPPVADKVNLAEGVWLAVFFLLLDAWVLNSSPTGSRTQRLLVESWDGTVALAEQLGTNTIEKRGMSWASTSRADSDSSAFMRRALSMTRRLLHAGVWVDERGTPILPQIPGCAGQTADFSWLQCFNALIGHRATRKARVALWAMACSDPDCRDVYKSPICVHILYAIHRHMFYKREPCVRCADYEMYFVPSAVTSEDPGALASSNSVPVSADSKVVNAARAPASDADCLLQCAASVSSLALLLPSFYCQANAAAASSGGVVAGTHLVTTASQHQFLSPRDRSELDATSKILHRLVTRQDVYLRASDNATTFAGARTAMRRLRTASEVAHSHNSARGVAADDPGPLGLLRRHCSLDPRAPNIGAAESNEIFVVSAAREAGQRLSAFLSQLTGGPAGSSTTQAAEVVLSAAAAGAAGDDSRAVESDILPVDTATFAATSIAMCDTSGTTTTASVAMQPEGRLYHFISTRSQVYGVTTTNPSALGRPLRLSQRPRREVHHPPIIDPRASTLDTATRGGASVIITDGSLHDSCTAAIDPRASESTLDTATRGGVLTSSTDSPATVSTLTVTHENDKRTTSSADASTTTAQQKRLRDQSEKTVSRSAGATLDTQPHLGKVAWAASGAAVGSTGTVTVTGMSLAQHHAGRSVCNHCGDDTSRWWIDPEDSVRYPPQFYMQCGVCSSIVFCEHAQTSHWQAAR